MARSGTPKMKVAPLPSLDKEGQAAAGGCCRGGLKPVTVFKSQRWGNHPRWALGPASPPQLRRGAYFQGVLRESNWLRFLVRLCGRQGHLERR